MKIYCVVIFFILESISFSQQDNTLKLQTEDEIKIIKVYSREGTAYIPIKMFADALSLNYNMNGTENISISGKKSLIKISGRNPFYSIQDKKGKVQKVFQLPTSTYMISGLLYIPVVYSLGILNEVLDMEMSYDDNSRLISTFKEQVERKDLNPVYDITSCSIEERANGTLIRFVSGKHIEEYNSFFKDGILIVVLKNSNADPVIPNGFTSSGLIKKLEIKKIGSDTEFRFHLGSEYSASEIIRIEGGNDLLLTIHNKIFTSRNQDRSKEKWDFDVIVIDAGHGGKDAGAIGINGAKEKDINLSIALKLGEMIEEEMPGVRVEYTRKTDTFVELYKRGRIANEKNGKLFISIHCNSTPSRNSSASGFEVYLLRPGRTQEAITIAERENSVIEYEDDPKRYQQLTDENFILVSMAHSSYMKYSEKFSEYLDSHFSNGFDLPNRGVKQAGFYVLVGASMPSVLIESGFLSNRSDAAFLNTTKGQEKTADLIFESIRSFKGYYESFLGMQ